MDIFGESENHIVDDRGRIFIPNRFKPFFEVGGYLMRALNGRCLVFYPGEALGAMRKRFADVKARLAGLDVSKFIQAELAQDDLARFMSAGAPATLDAQGRLVLPSGLRRRAGIENEVAVLALGDRVEIWAQERWIAYDEEKLSADALQQQLQGVSLSSPWDTESTFE
jgi:MraZ protein